MPTLSVTPVAVVCAGVKSVLDIRATLERLETLSVPVIGYRTKEFPAFWLRSSGIPIDWSLASAAEIAAVLRAQDADPSPRGLIVANPIAAELQWDPAEHDRVLAESFAAAEESGVRGKAVTPFLLGDIVTRSGGRSLEVNLDLVRGNIRLATEIAVAYAAR